MLSRLFHRWELHLSKRDRSRRFRPFEWGVDSVGNGIPIDDPKSYLLEHGRRAVERSDEFYGYETPTDYRLEGLHLKFTSPIRTASPTNNTVHGWYFPAQSRGRVVLVLPQWNSNAQGHLRLCRILNLFGLSSLRLSLPYHDLRMPEELVRADYMLSPNLGRTIQSMQQAVIDCRCAFDWLQSEGFEEFAILGTSLGSCIALIAMAHDARPRITVQNHVSPYFADVVWTGISTKHVKAGLEGNVELDELRQIWMPISPRPYLKKLQGSGKRSLLIHARYDHSFLPYLSQKVLDDYEDLQLPHDALELYCGHYTSGEFPFNIALGFSMCNYLRKNL